MFSYYLIPKYYIILGLDRMALKEIIRCAIAYEATYPHRQMLWFQEAIQNQGLYFKQVNPGSLSHHS
jgi:hypothetical protein